MRCPKCGFVQFAANFCKKCGADLRSLQSSGATAFAPPPASSSPTAKPQTFDPNYQPPNPTAPPAPVFTPPMSSTPVPSFPPLPVPGAGAKMEDEKTIKDKLKMEGQIKGGASAFYWVAVLSLINSIIILFGGKWNFLIGLGITRFIDAVAHELARGLGHMVSVIAFILDLFITGIFVAFGYFAGKRRNWSFILGMILYAVDGLLFLLVGDFLSMGFHGLILVWIFMGFRANAKLTAMERSVGYA